MTALTAEGTTRPRLSLATLSLVLFLTFLDNTIVSVTLSNIQSSLHTGVSDLQWVVSAYALVFASLMLAAGTISDRVGRKKVMLIGVAIFCAGSVLGALAPNVAVLWAARGVMGLGAAASEPVTLSMIRHLYTDRRERAQALGVWAAVSGLALAAGPVIGGALVGVWSWRAVFWFNLFFGLIALIGAAVVLPENSDPQRGRFDFAGLVTGGGSIACLTFAIIAGETSGYATWWIEMLYVISAVAMVAFILIERRTESPILDVRFFKIPAFAGSTFVAFATYFGVFSIFFFVALYLEVVGGQSGYQIAIDFLPMAGALVIASAFAGRWVANMGPRIPMTVGCLLAAAGTVLTSATLDPTSNLHTLGWTLPMAGIGFGVAIVAVTSTALGVIPKEHSGMAASATNTSRELGAVFGVAVLGSVVNGQLTVQLAKRLQHFCLISFHGKCALYITPAIRQQVLTAVTTGSITTQAKSEEKNKAIAAVANRVTGVAYDAFSHGLNLSLGISAGLMAVSAIVALTCIRQISAKRAAEFGDLAAEAPDVSGSLIAEADGTVVPSREDVTGANGSTFPEAPVVPDAGDGAGAAEGVGAPLRPPDG